MSGLSQNSGEHCNSDAMGAPEKRRQRSVSEKRRIVEASFKAGASVGAVAKAHGLHPTQLYKCAGCMAASGRRAQERRCCRCGWPRRGLSLPGPSRQPMLSWTRDLPIAGEPEDVVRIVDSYAQCLSTSLIPKLFIDANPAGFLVGAPREFCRSWPNQTTVTVKGAHFLQEESPEAVARRPPALSARCWLGRSGDVMNRELHYLELLELAELLRRREITSVQATEAQLERIAQLDPHLASYALVDAEGARDSAAAADAEIAAGKYRGPRHGVPAAVKDLFLTKGIRTSPGMPIHRDFCPDHDATAVAHLRAAGTVILGKL